MKDLFVKRFRYYKDLAEKTFAQLTEEQMFWQPNTESNSVAVTAKHLAGNMVSRWTNFLTEDGEKSWRHRDGEFINDFKTKKEVLDFWEEGCRCFLNASGQINDENLHQTIYIRQEPHTVEEALLRHLLHFSYHVGQIVYLGKMMKNEEWETLSVPRNKSEDYNIEMLKKQSASEIPQNASPVCYAKSDEVREEYRS